MNWETSHPASREELHWAVEKGRFLKAKRGRKTHYEQRMCCFSQGCPPKGKGKGLSAAASLVLAGNCRVTAKGYIPGPAEAAVRLGSTSGLLMWGLAQVTPCLVCCLFLTVLIASLLPFLFPHHLFLLYLLHFKFVKK